MWRKSVVKFFSTKRLHLLSSAMVLKVVLVAVAVALIITSIAINAGVFIVYNAGFDAEPQPPPLTFTNPSTPGTALTLGPNETWANVTVKATTSYVEVTRNGGFDTSPNGWLYGYTVYSGYALATALWNQTYLGASGAVLLYLRLYNPSSILSYVNGSIYLVQNVTIPATALSSAVLNVTYNPNYNTSYASLTSYYLYAELLSPNGTLVWSGSQPVSPSSIGVWSNASFSIPVTSLTPGATYTLIVGVNVAGRVINFPFFGIVGNVTIYQYFDSVRLYVKPSYPAFSGTVLDLNVSSGSYVTQLSIDALRITGSTNVNLTLFLANYSGGASSPAVVTEGAVTSRSTSSIYLTTPPAGYTSGYLRLSASINSSSVVNAVLKLTYGTGGVAVTYFINLTVIDPPGSHGVTRANHCNACKATRGVEGGAVTARVLERVDRIVAKYVMRGLLPKGLVPLLRWRG